MNILITSGIYPPQVGGPAEYAFNLNQELLKRGHKVSVVSYEFEKNLPPFIRHLYVLGRILYKAIDADVIYTFDTYSVGVPSLFASVLLRVPLIVRIGGDFLWEKYVERTGNKIPLSAFYDNVQDLSLKEQVVFLFTKLLVKGAKKIVFTTEWQKEIWQKPYKPFAEKTLIVENYYPVREKAAVPTAMNFIWAVRPIKLKNGDTLRAAFSRLQKDVPNAVLDDTRSTHEELMQRISECYAVVLPSISEVCPNLIIDAIKFGKPFLCTGDSGIYAKLQDVGVFVDPLSGDSIYEGLRKLSDPAQYAQYVQKVQNFTYTHSWSEIADEFLNAYKSPQQHENY